MEGNCSDIRDINVYVYCTITKMDAGNKVCNDCGASYPKFASINNGVVLCLSCTDKHRSLTNRVSFLRSLNDVWDEYLLLYLIRGGNSRFKETMNKYKIVDDAAIDYKYKTKAAEYHRQLLRSEVLADEPPQELEVEIGNEISHECLNLYPEFDDMYINSELQNLSEKINYENSRHLSSKLYQTSQYIGETISHLSTRLGENLYNYGHSFKGYSSSIQNKYQFKDLVKKTFKVLKKAGKYVVETSTPYLDSTCNYLRGNTVDKEEVKHFLSRRQSLKSNII